MTKIRSEQVSYKTSTSKKDFPNKVSFTQTEGNLVFVNMTHISDFTTQKVSLSLYEAISALQEKGWEFEGQN